MLSTGLHFASESTEGGQSDLKAGLNEVKADVKDVKKKVANAVRERRDFPDEHTDKWGVALDRFFDGKDPIDGKTPLRDGCGGWLRELGPERRRLAQFHHLYNANRTGLYDGVPVSAAMHAEIDGKDQDYRCEIDFFHLRLRQVVSDVIQPSFL
jgi:hypothetical protein